MRKELRGLYEGESCNEWSDKMQEVNIHLPNNLVHGTLVWIDASNYKIYYSSKRYDVAEFTEHDSNYVGEFGEIFSMEEEERDSIKKMIKGSERIFGIYLRDSEEQIEINKDTINAEVQFFSTWEKLQEFAEDYFKKYDRIESEKKEEKHRRKQAKNAWLERGRRFIKENSNSPK